MVHVPSCQLQSQVNALFLIIQSEYPLGNIVAFSFVKAKVFFFILITYPIPFTALFNVQLCWAIDMAFSERPLFSSKILSINCKKGLIIVNSKWFHCLAWKKNRSKHYSSQGALDPNTYQNRVMQSYNGCSVRMDLYLVQSGFIF